MRDNLDLQELRERVDYYKTSGRKRRNRSLILTLGIFIVISVLWIQFYSESGGVYFLNSDQEWLKEKNFSSFPIEFQQANRDLWLQSANPYRMTRMDGEYRYYYDSSDFEECCIEFDGPFTTLGDTVFAVQDDDMLYWNTIEWELKEDWFPVDDVVDIVASKYYFAFTDSENHIYVIGQSDGWQQISSPQISETAPQLHAISNDENDTIYLIQDGLWGYDYGSSSWDFMLDLSPHARLLGDDKGVLWFVDGSEILKYEPSTDIPTGYSFDAIGIAPNTAIRHIFTDRRGTYLATNDAILRIDDNSWERMPAPQNTPYGILSVGVNPKGAWLVTSTDLDLVAEGGGMLEYNSLIQLVLFIIALIVPLLVIIYMWFVPYLGSEYERASRSRKLLITLFPTLPDYQSLLSDTKSLSRMMTSILLTALLFLIILVIVMMLGVFEIASDNIPVIINLSAAITLGISLPIYFFSYLRKTNKITRQLHMRHLKFVSFGILKIGVCFVIVSSVYKFLFPSILSDNTSILVLGLSGVVLLICIVLLIAVVKPSAFYPKGLPDGHYDLALEGALERRKRSNNNIVHIQQHALVLSYAGRYEEAQVVWLEDLELVQNSTSLALGILLANLGYVAERLGDHDRALLLYQASISILPESPIPYRLLVNFYQNQRIHPDRALELSQAMISWMPKRINRLVITRMEEGTIYATHALALANMRQLDEANMYIQKAFDVTDAKFIPSYSHLLRKAGHVKLAQGQAGDAMQLFNQAREIDPHGDTAKLLQHDLDSINQPSDNE